MPELSEDGRTVDQVTAQDKRDAADVGAPPEDDYVRALLEERHGYEVHGRADRVAAVDEQLAARGYKAAGEARAAAGTKPGAAPKSRRKPTAEEQA